jgi:hypothetical protein
MLFHRRKPQSISDNTEALAVIMSLGVLGELDFPEYGVGDDGRPIARVLFHTIHGHPTHWILAARFHGFEREEENGYMVMTWPKARFPERVLDEEVARFNAQPALRSVRDLPPPNPAVN